MIQERKLKTKRFIFRVQDELHRQLRKEARNHDMSISAYLSFLLKSHQLRMKNS